MEKNPQVDTMIEGFGVEPTIARRHSQNTKISIWTSSVNPHQNTKNQKGPKRSQVNQSHVVNHHWS